MKKFQLFSTAILTLALVLLTPSTMASAYTHTNVIANQPLTVNQAFIPADDGHGHGHGHNSTRTQSTDCTGTNCLDISLADSSDSYTRYWAVFYGSPGAYQGSGVWANEGSNLACKAVHSSGDNMGCNSMSTSTYLYFCVSVPDTGFSPGYSGSAIRWKLTIVYDGTDYPSGVTEGNCYQGNGIT